MSCDVLLVWRRRISAQGWPAHSPFPGVVDARMSAVKLEGTPESWRYRARQWLLVAEPGPKKTSMDL